jgi:hypothetical protein
VQVQRLSVVGQPPSHPRMVWVNGPGSQGGDVTPPHPAGLQVQSVQPNPQVSPPCVPAAADLMRSNGANRISRSNSSTGRGVLRRVYSMVASRLMPTLVACCPKNGG